jgi:hypothetical protein
LIQNLQDFVDGSEKNNNDTRGIDDDRFTVIAIYLPSSSSSEFSNFFSLIIICVSFLFVSSQLSLNQSKQVSTRFKIEV